MIAVLTGDIVNSRDIDPKLWLKELKNELSEHGLQWKDWEVYRGDSFQLKVPQEKALEVAVFIKARIKKFKELDVRIAIGLGDIDYVAERVTESNGSAFSNSGECFDSLKKSNLEIRSSWQHFDRTINLMLHLAALTMDSWSPVSSQILLTGLKFPELNQIELAEKLQKKSQGTISEGLKRGGYEEIHKLLLYYKDEISKKCL
ncbi:MAG: transcriptional regulator, partial [Crocinitomicaceae bacterium]